MNTYTVASGLSANGISRLVEEGEKNFEKQVKELTANLLSVPSLHLIGLTGPTCSGKTTAAKIMTSALELNGKRLHTVSIDDFYFDKSHLLAKAKAKGLEAPDYDSEDTIDVDLLRECAVSLMEGRKTALPHYNFHTGNRESGEVILPVANDLFLFEGIQILYPKVEQILTNGAYRSIYICPVSAVQTGGQTFLPNEIRLMRRLVRDYRYRATSPEFTFFLWESVRSNEEKNIFPYVKHCDYRVDSTMPYEIGMLKPLLEPLLSAVPQDNKFSGAAEEILARLRNVQPFSESLIPENSLYKEFI